MTKLFLVALVLFFRLEVALCGGIIFVYVLYMWDLIVFRPLRELEARLDEVQRYLSNLRS